MPEQEIEFPFQHPACKEAKELFRALEVYSDEDYRKLPRRDRYVWDVSWFECEVMNGGVDQFLYNSAGDHAIECLGALKAIGAARAYCLLKQACDLFPDGKPSPRHEIRRWQLLELKHGKQIDHSISGEIEVELYQLLLNYYRTADAGR